MLKGLGRIALTGGVLALGTALAVPAFAPSAHAVEEKMAKGLGKDVDWINAPVMDQFAQLRGRVIFIDLWGIN